MNDEEGDANAKGDRRRVWTSHDSRCRLSGGCGIAAFAIVLALAALSRDGVPIDHLDYAMAYYDRRDVLISRWEESPALPLWPHPPTYSPREKRALGLWRNFDDEAAPDACTPVADTPLVWTLKTPKAASSTLQDLILGLARQDPGRFVVNTRQLRVNPSQTSPALRGVLLERYAEYFSGLRRRTVYTAHGWFIDLERGGSPPIIDGQRNGPESRGGGSAASVRWAAPAVWAGVRYRPVCIGTIRSPLARLLSHYDYLHFGPRSVWSLARHGEPGAAGSSSSGSAAQTAGAAASSPPAFGACVAAHMEALARGETGSAADPWKCVHWAGIQLRYFCGYGDFDTCNAAGPEALATAWANVQRHFLVVALVERFPEALALLETLLPSVFQGAAALFAAQGSSRVNTKKPGAPAARRVLQGLSPAAANRSSARQGYDALPADVATFIAGRLRHEEALYERLALRFDRQTKACHERG